MPTGSWDRSGLLRRWIAIITSMALLVLGNLAFAPTARADDPLPAPPPVLQRGSDHVTADNLPTVQINDGYVWAQTTIGTTVYAVGQFNNVRPAGAAKDTNLTPRQNVLAYNITNGNLITSFAPTVSGVVKAVAASPDGSRIYIGGSFNSVNGQTRYNFAALDASTGQLVSGFAPSVGGSGVYAIAATSGAVYVGGLFTQGNGTARKNLAAFAPGNGALLPWAPTTDLQVDAMVMEPQTGQVVAGGRFYSVNSQISRGLANLDPTSGALNTSWQAPQTVQNGWNSGADAGKAGIFALNTDSSGVYGTGWVFSSVTVGNLEGAFAADAGSGKIRWVSDCHGDHYGIYSSGSVVYTTSHTHQCDTVNLWPEQTERTYRYVESYTTAAKGTLTRSPSVGSIYKDWSGTPAPSAYNWFPDFLVGTTSGLGQAGLSITGTAGYVSIAGEFGSVNNGLVQGLTRFSTNPPGGAKQAPRVQTADWVPQAISVNPGTARVSIPANWDRDDLNLTYTLRRQGTSTPVATKTVASTWWNQPTVALTDTGLTPGTSYTYTITATDSDGNSRISSPTTVTATAGTTSAYGSAVLPGHRLEHLDGQCTRRTVPGGMVQNHQHPGRQDPRLRGPADRHLQQLRPPHLHGQQRPRHLRRLPRLGADDHQPAVLQRRQLAPCRLPPRQRRHEALHRRHPGGLESGRHLRPELQRLLADRRGQPQRLDQSAELRLLQRSHRRRGDLPDNLERRTDQHPLQRRQGTDPADGLLHLQQDRSPGILRRLGVQRRRRPADLLLLMGLRRQQRGGLRPDDHPQLLGSRHLSGDPHGDR